MHMSVNVDTAATDNVLLLVHGTYTPATAFRLNWVVSDPSSVLGNPTLVALDTIQNVIIPNGALTADQDIVYFTYESRSGIAIIKRQDNSSDNVHIDSLAVILPTSASSSQVHTWHYISDLKNILSTHTDVETRRQAAISWYSANVIRKRGRSVRVFDPKTVTWEEQLADSSYHPLHNLPLFLRVFGPSFVTVYKYVLARNRVVIYIPPEASNNTPSQTSNHPNDLHVDRPAESDSANNNSTTIDPSSLLTRPCELASSLTHILSALCGGKDRPWAVGFLDSDGSSHNALLDDSSSGWIACTSDKQFILSHLPHIDLLVDFSPVFNLVSLLETETSTSSSDGIKPPLLLVPPPSSSTAEPTFGSSLQLRPTRFTLLDIQLWGDIQGVMKRIERAKQRALRHPGMNGNKDRKGGRNGRGSVSDSEDWDDGDFAVPGGWNLSSTNGNISKVGVEDTPGEHDEGVSVITTQETTDPTLQPPPLPQKLHYTLDLITAFHRHVVSLSKNYATMATTTTKANGSSNFPSSSSANSHQSPQSHNIEFDDLERLFLEGGRRRRGSLLNGVLEPSPAAAVHGSSNLVDGNNTLTSMSAAINGNGIGKGVNGNGVEGGVSETSTISSLTIEPLERRVSMRSGRRSPTPTPLSFSKAIRSSSRSPPRPHGTSSKVRLGSRSRSSSRESERTTLALVDAAAQVQTNVNPESPNNNNIHIYPTPSSPLSSFSPPPYPYIFPKSYPRRPDTATSFSSTTFATSSSQFVTPENSPILTARNSPVVVEEGMTPKVVTGMKGVIDDGEDDVEPLVLDIPDSVVPPVGVSFAVGKERIGVEEEEEVNGGGMDHDDKDKDQSRNSVSFPSPSSTPAPVAILSTPVILPNPSPSKKSFSHKRSYSDDVSHNPPMPGLVISSSGRESPSSPPPTSSSPSKDKPSSGILPTDSQLLEVEAELREQEARMLAPSPTPPGLASPVLGPRKVKGWSVPTSIFLGKREKEELAETGEVDVKAPIEEQKQKDDNAGAGGIDRNLVLTPVEVLWERRREGSASPSKEISAPSPPPPPPPTPLPNSSTSSLATLPPYLFSPQPLPPGAAAPSPNVGPVITSIIDALRGAIALNGTSPSPEATASTAHTYDRDSPPLTPPPPLLSAYSGSSSSPTRTPTPQSLSGRETPRGLPKIDEEEEEGSVNGDDSYDGGGRKRVSLVRQHQHNQHRPPIQGHATDSGDADAEGPDDGETGSMASSTAAGSVSLNPNSGSGSGPSNVDNNTRSSPSPIPPPPSPGFLTTTTVSTPASAPSISLSPSPHPFAPSPSPSPSPTPPSPTPPSASAGVSVSSPTALKPKSKSGSNNSTPTPNSSPTKNSKSPVLKKNTTVKGHATSSSLSNPSPSTSSSSSSSSSLISNLTKSFSLKIRPRRLSLLSSGSGSGLKKGDDVSSGGKDVVGVIAEEEENGNKVKNSVMNRKSRSVPNTIGSTGSITSPTGSSTTASPTSLSLSNGTSSSPSTSLSSATSANISFAKPTRIRSRATTSSGSPSSSSSSSKEPVFNMVTTLMSAEDGGNIEEWNGRNSGIGTLALANEMRRAQEESNKRKSGVAVVAVVGAGGGGGREEDTNWSPMESAAAAVPVSPPGLGLSSSKLAPSPKKGILRIRRASLTALPSPSTVIAESSNSGGRNSGLSTSSSSRDVGKRNPSPSPTSTITAPSPSPSPSSRDQKKSKSTPTLKPKSMFTELMPTEENQPQGKDKEKEDPSSSSSLSRVRRDSLGLIKKGKGLLNMNTSSSASAPPPPPPPVPALPYASGSTESAPAVVESGLQSVRSNTPDSTRRKLRKRRKSLIVVDPLVPSTMTSDV